MAAMTAMGRITMSAIAQDGREEEEEEEERQTLLWLHVLPLGQQPVPQTKLEEEQLKQ
jgi:hypothetical protein